jgi:CBS domain-containing protein
MSVPPPRATPATALLPMLAEGECDAVPVLKRGRIVGIVTRTEMIVALARQSLRNQAADLRPQPLAARTRPPVGVAAQTRRAPS